MMLRNLCALSALTLAVAAPALAQRRIEVGSEPTYTFRSEPVNGMGVKSIEELRGKPLLVEFWGVH